MIQMSWSTCILGELGRLAMQGTDGALGWTSVPPVLILVRNACSYYVCMRSVVVIQFPTLKAKEMSLHRILWYRESTNVKISLVTLIPLIQS